MGKNPTSRLKNLRLGLVFAVLPLAPAAAQPYMPQAIKPNPDVYGFLAQNPVLDGIYGRAVGNQFSHLYIFGNSYADWGNVVAAQGAGGVGGPTSATNRYGNALSMGDGLEYDFGLRTAQVSNYAVGGAFSGFGNIIPTPNVGNSTGTEAQIDVFLSAGGRFSPAQLVDITTFAGNDILKTSQLGVAGAVAETLAAEQTDVRLLVNAGARTLTITSGGDAGLLPATMPGGLISGAVTSAIANAYDSQAFAGEQQFLTAYNRSSTRVFLFDVTSLERRMIADPAPFGFTNVTQACTTVPACAQGSLAVQDQYLTYDGLHLSTQGFAWVARYQSNQVQAPSTIAAQSNLALATARNFTGAIFNRIDGIASDTAVMRRGDSPFSLFLQGGTAVGSMPDQQYAFGMSYDIPFVGFGGEYRIDANLDLGVEANYSHPHAGIDQGEGSVTIDSYLFAGFAHYHPKNWFADGIVDGGTANYAIKRSGVFNPITASTQGGSFTLAGKLGWNAYDLAGLQLAPVAGLDYSRITEDGYTESGDDLLDQRVGGQSVNSLVADAGLLTRYGLSNGPADMNFFGTFLINATIGNNDHDVVTAQTSTPGIKVLTVIPGAGSIVYEEAAAGVSASLTKQLRVQAIIGGMFGGHSIGSSVNFSADIAYRF